MVGESNISSSSLIPQQDSSSGANFERINSNQSNYEQKGDQNPSINSNVYQPYLAYGAPPTGQLLNNQLDRQDAFYVQQPQQQQQNQGYLPEKQSDRQDSFNSQSQQHQNQGYQGPPQNYPLPPQSHTENYFTASQPNSYQGYNPSGGNNGIFLLFFF